MYNSLSKILKNMKGNVLVVGLNDKLLENFDKNNEVNLYSINSLKTNGISSKSKKKQTNQGKSINIKKLRKYIKKRSVDYFVINMEEVFNYYKYIIKDSIYLTNNLLYIYSSNEIDKQFIVNKYKRYSVNIKTSEYKGGYIITIDNTNGKNNRIMDVLYFIKDTFYNIAEFIGNVLIS